MFAEMIKCVSLAALVVFVAVQGTATNYQILLNLIVCGGAIVVGLRTPSLHSEPLIVGRGSL